MANNFPGSLNTGSSLANNRTTGQTIPASDHNDLADAQIAVETKIGYGSSTPVTPGHVLTVTSAGQTAWAPAPSGGGSGSSSALTASVTQVGHGLGVGDAVRYNGSAWVKAKAVVAYAGDQSSDVLGVVTAVADSDHFVVTTDGQISGLSGLTAGKMHYLSSATAGALTTTPPYTDSTVVKPVLFATSATTGVLKIERGMVNVVSRTYPRMGINFGYSNLTSNAQILRELQYLGRYTKKLRISIPSWNDTTGITNIRNIVTIANSLGFETTYGVTAAGTGHNAAYVDSWLAQVNTEAAWADANGVDIFYIGNEEDWWTEIGGITGYTVSQIQDKVLQKAQDLKALYPNLKLAYSTAEGEFLQWDAKVTANTDWEYLDYFGINMYNADFEGTLQYALTLAFAGKLFLSEWADEATYAAGGKTASAYRAEILARRQAIEAAGVDAYFFTWDWGGSYGSTDDWGLANGDNTYKPGFEQIFSIPR